MSKSEMVQMRLLDRIKEAKERGYTQMSMVELQTWLRQLNIMYPHIRREYVAWLEANGHITLDSTGVIKYA
jgi:hypothetical protein